MTDNIDPPALEHEIIAMASEDMYGLHEIIWTLNVSHKDVSKADKITAAQHAVSSLMSRGLIVLHRLRWDPTQDFGEIPSAATERVLKDPMSWEAGQEYSGFVATAEGRRAYLQGTFARRGLTEA